MTDPLVSLNSGCLRTSIKFSKRIKTCNTRAGLAAISNPGTELVIWRRALPSCLQTWFKEIKPSRPSGMRVLVRQGDLRSAVEPYLDDFGMPAGDMRDLLIGDFDELISSFASIARSDMVDVRLECISHNSCWRFHRDFVETRLLTTYCGPATEWVQPFQAERALLEQKSYKGPLERLRLHDVAIFKGNQAGPESGIVHRSPPIADTDRKRLLLCLNKPSAASPEPRPRVYDKYALYI